MVQWSNADPINQIHRQNVGWPAASGGQAAASRAEFSTLLCKPLRFSSFQKVSKWFINHIYIYHPYFIPYLWRFQIYIGGISHLVGPAPPSWDLQPPIPSVAWDFPHVLPCWAQNSRGIWGIWVLGLSGLLFCQKSMSIVIIIRYN
jgi:hypothetical protein